VVDGPESESARHLAQRTGQIGFPGARGAADQHIVVGADPLACGQRGDQPGVQPARGAGIQIFQGCGGEAEPRLRQPPCQPPVLLGGQLAIHQEAEPRLEAEVLDLRHRQLLGQRRGHAGEFQGL